MHKKLRAHIEKTVTLTDDEFDLLLPYFTLKHFHKKEFLFERGQKVEYAYYVVSGLLKLVFVDKDASEHIVSFAMEDWWESDFSAFFMKTRATMSLVCLEETSVYCIAHDDYWSLCNSMPKIERFLLQKSNMGFIGAQQRVLSLLTTNAKERYEQLITQSPSLLQRVSKTQLASYLGVSRETLSRLFIQ
ncbi:Crp/Fnr family transcriptional regulator [Reichenbachiella agarivorans]|uniref:Crp/Fnr family transcriptional regulator n=1 Tax=Reichenbachiella agarivorans TaxID=2979464 RepID=A0ABY6CJY6_9BACT|nr:Crp/Fnr family transcriptional regulator [Reichenbachiella agarivorans]UXP30832.1 Crp/Fnr family transcriptional regulator [Reichenbachiella agarivorans]